MPVRHYHGTPDLVQNRHEGVLVRRKPQVCATLLGQLSGARVRIGADHSGCGLMLYLPSCFYELSYSPEVRLVQARPRYMHQDSGLEERGGDVHKKNLHNGHAGEDHCKSQVGPIHWRHFD